jgi:SAM-dependent methyltransferase
MLCYGREMWNDIVDLRDFYASARGRVVARLVTQRLRDIWPNLTGHRVLGMGFPTPFLNPLLEDAERTIAAMPAGQGVLHWPSGRMNLTVLTEEHILPLSDRSVDRLLLVHCLESSSQLQPLLRECWRVLADGGRLLVVVANRRGLWARSEGTPFALGRPYSVNQITRLLRDNLYAPVETAGVLFAPPFWWRFFGSWALALERIGARVFPTFAGLLVVEAEKQIYAAPFDGAPARAARRGAIARPAGSDI